MGNLCFPANKSHNAHCSVEAKGLLLPLGGEAEDGWDICSRGFLYLSGLVYFFVGVAILSDIFMASIETIVSRTKLVTLEWGDGLAKMKYNVRVTVWNGTVANLTLMALGSSAPEILLSVIEICSSGFNAGKLGPGTIVGSAAFNLLVITGVCVYKVPKGETRRIDIYRVFLVTTIFSLFAYIWMVIVLVVISPNIVEIWEALITFVCFPKMVGIAWWADNEFFRCCKKRKMRQSVQEQLIELRRIHEAMEHGGKLTRRNSSAELQLYDSDGHINPQAVIAFYKRIKVVAEVSDEEAATLLAMKLVDSRAHDRLWYRIGAVRALMGGGKLSPVLNEKLQEVYKVLNQMHDGDGGVTFHMGMGRRTEHFRNKAIIEFEAASIAVPENIGYITIPLIRKGREDNEVKVFVHTIEGTAKKDSDFEPIVDQEVIFEPYVFEQSVSVKIIDDNQWEPEEYFYVRVSIDESENQDAVIGRTNTIEITILDDDSPGNLTFTERAMLVLDTVEEIEITVARHDGSDGIVSCRYRTKPDQVHSPIKHPDPINGEITFNHGERSKTITIPLMTSNKPIDNETFVVELYDPEGGTSIGTIDSIQVTISRDENFEIELTKVVERANSVVENVEIESKITYCQQIKCAFLVNGGDTENATKLDYVLHFLTIFWKVLFSTIPPPWMCGGWLCFIFSLVAVGILTAIIGDMAGIFGCLIGLDDTITAITLVALGTSLPDMFASAAAAVHDKNADNAIGNVTGSNSVNVFLGLGIPWTIAAIYHQFIKLRLYPPSPAQAAFMKKYAHSIYSEGDFSLDIFKDDEEGYKTYVAYLPYFVVKSDSLVYSVIVYNICAIFALAFLVMRRYLDVWGHAELGGPTITKVTTMIVFILLWLLYVGLSWVYVAVPGFKNFSFLHNLL